MQYFIRQSKDAEVSGPYAVSELATAISSSGLSPHSYASSDLGESVVQLQKWRSCDWFRLSEIAELKPLLPSSPPAAVQPRRTTILTLVGQFVATLASVYLATTLHHWVFWLFGAANLVSFAGSIISYSNQKELKSHPG